MKKVMWILLPAMLLFVGTAAAQDQDRMSPMFEKGTKELGFTGYIDFEGPAGGVDTDLDLRYGYFMNRHIEIGGFGNYSRTMDGDVVRYGLGGFAEYHMFGSGWARTIPYFGADLGLFALNWDAGENQNALAFVPRIGIKWFFRDYVAVDTNFYLGLATEDIYINDYNSDKYDFGIKFGLRVYF
ncbi:MAG: hypothetical protein KFF68_13450 [Desulfosarcina sp.]|nr:hypothetical protein [Desulfosarcina sp.]